MLNFANILTLSRFATAPVFLLLLLKMPTTNAAVYSISATILLILTLFTDMFDGMVARAQNQVTDFGKIMDPVADSTFFLTALFALSAASRFSVPIWLPLIVLYREIGMHVLRRYAALSGLVLASKLSGKIKMVIQSVVLVLLMLLVCAIDLSLLKMQPETLKIISSQAVVLIVLVNLISIIEYLYEIPGLSRNGKKNAGTEE